MRERLNEDRKQNIRFTIFFLLMIINDYGKPSAYIRYNYKQKIINNYLQL